jgi:hypothetical protein
MSAARPGTLGTTRVCPHCKATVLESASVCPGCQHHLRFNAAEVQPAAAGYSALQVEGTIRHRVPEEPCEYCIVLSIRNERGELLTRQVVGVGALLAAEAHTVSISVELLPPSRSAAIGKRN